MPTHQYQQALDYIFSFIDFSLTHQENISPDKFELERMDAFAKLLDNPHNKYPTIHVAGTKGKGSVAALCASALRAGGYKVGLYISPHLNDFRERICINGELMAEAAFAEILEQIKPVVPELPGITSYEIQTMLAFQYFARQQVDIAVVEVGLGGRLDSTNIVTPLVSVITSISLDHTNVLGDTLAQIAAEKGGIIKPGVPLVSSPQRPEALAVLQHIAEENDSPMTLVGHDLYFNQLSDSLQGQKVQMDLSNGKVDFNIPLLGKHQAENTATAFATMQALTSQGWQLPLKAIGQGFARVEWPGRFEIVQDNPYVVLDGAHNTYSATKLSQSISSYFPDRKVVLLFGASEDKDIPAVFDELLPITHTLMPVQAEHPRAISVDKLAETAASYACEVQIFSSIQAAIQQGMAVAGKNGVVLITGSLYLVGEARRVWFTHFAEGGYNK